MVDYVELAVLADNLFEISDDDDERLAEALDTLDSETREALLSSDLLNAYQVFYYSFRETPDALVRERLQLRGAADLARGVVIAEIEIYEVIFFWKDGVPILQVTDGDTVDAEIRGSGAYQEMIRYLNEWF
jgi:hypothetical protein